MLKYHHIYRMWFVDSVVIYESFGRWMIVAIFYWLFSLYILNLRWNDRFSFERGFLFYLLMCLFIRFLIMLLKKLVLVFSGIQSFSVSGVHHVEATQIHTPIGQRRDRKRVANEKEKRSKRRIFFKWKEEVWGCWSGLK